MGYLKGIRASIKNYKFNSMFVKNLIIIALLLLVPLNVVCFFFYQSSSEAARREVSQSNANSAQMLASVIDSVVSEVETLTINTALQNDILNYLLYPPDANEVSESQVNMSRYIKNFTYVHSYLDSIYIYCEKNDTVLHHSVTMAFDQFNDKGWISAYRSQREDRVETVLRARNDLFPFYLTMVMPVYATSTDQLGAVVVNLDIQKLVGTFRELDQTGLQKFYIIRDDGTVIYSPEKNDILKSRTEIAMLGDVGRESETELYGRDYMVNAVPSSRYGWSYYSASPLTAYQERISSILLLQGVLVASTLLIAVLISFYISIRTFKPIGNIIELIDSPGGWEKNLYEESPDNETAYILKQINQTLETNRDLREKLDTRLAALNRVQTIALQAQINPHFLYNTLDTINWIAVSKLGLENEVSEALAVLSGLYKMNADTTDYLTELKKEVGYTKQYIEILFLRHRGAFDISWEIGGGLEEVKIPRMLLQPLIENSVYHGIKPKLAPGRISICIWEKNDMLFLSVEDDGVGMGAEQVEELNRIMEEDCNFFGMHIGLKNVNQRIKLIYGNAYGARIESGGGLTRVTLRLPLTR